MACGSSAQELEALGHRGAAFERQPDDEPKGQPWLHTLQKRAGHPRKEPLLVEAILAPDPDVAAASVGIAIRRIGAIAHTVAMIAVEIVIVSANEGASALGMLRRDEHDAALL